MPVAADAAGVTLPITSPGQLQLEEHAPAVSRNRSNSAASSLHSHVSVSIGHCRRMLFAAESRNSPVRRWPRYPEDVVAYATAGSSGR